MSTRNRCLPLDFTTWEKCLVPETGNESRIALWNECLPLDFTTWEKCLVPETGNGSRIALWNDDDTSNFEAPKPGIEDNCHTRLRTAAIFGFQEQNPQALRMIKATFAASQLQIEQTTTTDDLLLYPHEESAEVCFCFSVNKKEWWEWKWGNWKEKKEKIDWHGEVWKWTVVP